MANIITSIKTKVISLFSSHERRIKQIEEYRDKPVTLSSEFKKYGDRLLEETREKCSKAVHNNSFDLYGWYSGEWNLIDEECIKEKIGLYRRYYEANSHHENSDAAARSRLLEIRHELTSVRNQLDLLYEKYLYSQTVYRKSADADTENSTDTAPAAAGASA